ncbi:MAG: DEAD/DEAH box helicase family protein, partial [Sphingobium sp.]
MPRARIPSSTDSSKGLILRDAANALVSASRFTGFVGEFDIDDLPHQTRMVERIWDNDCNCVLADPTGTGKQFVTMNLTARYIRQDPSARILIIAPGATIPQLQNDFYIRCGFDFEVFGEDFFVRRDEQWKKRKLVIASVDR